MQVYRKKQEQEMCPICGDTDNQQTNDSGVYDEYYVYHCECAKCGAKYNDWYLMIYQDTEYEVETKNENS